MGTMIEKKKVHPTIPIVQHGRKGQGRKESIFTQRTIYYSLTN